MKNAIEKVHGNSLQDARYISLRSVSVFVCLLTPWPFMDCKTFYQFQGFVAVGSFNRVWKINNEWGRTNLFEYVYVKDYIRQVQGVQI